MRNFFIFLTGFLILLIPEIFKIYWIMPFPGSQVHERVQLAYFVNHYIWILRIAGLLIIARPAYYYIVQCRWGKKIAAIVPLIIYCAVFYFGTFMARADKMFYQPQTKIFLSAADNKIDKTNQVIAVEINGETKAYPIELIGFHHQVQDTVGNTAVMVTYCTVCRTGRVYSPVVDGQRTDFRLIGMDHFNAMFEDGETKSWWRQATGECVAGKMKGHSLEEIPSEQMSLNSWMEKHPDTKIMQPDPHFEKQYTFLLLYDEGTITDPLEKTNWNSWELKSWVVGVKTADGEKAYDWNDVQEQRIINDTIKNTAVLIMMEEDTASFHTYNRNLDTLLLEFVYENDTKRVKDTKTGSSWNYAGHCVEGPLQGKQLLPVQSYQEFWHSWKTFHPHTTKYSK